MPRNRILVRIGDAVKMAAAIVLSCLLLATCAPLAFADDDIETGASEVWETYKDESVTAFAMRQRVINDLGWRWFNASDQTRVPLSPKNFDKTKTLNEYLQEYGTPSAAYDAFQTDISKDWLFNRYNLVTYEDQYHTWDVTGNWAEQHYKEWYDALNGIVIPEGGGGGNTGTVEGSGIVDYVINYGSCYGKVYKNWLGTANVVNRATVGSNFKTNVEQYLEDYPYVYYWSFQNSTASNTQSPTVTYYYIMSDAPISVTGPSEETGKLYYKDDAESSVKNADTTLYSLSVSTTGNYKLFSKTNMGIGSYSVGSTLLELSPFVSSYNNNSGTNYEYSLSKKPSVWVAYAGANDPEPEPEIPPVTYPPEPEPSTPQQPASPDAPTYQGDNYNTINNIVNDNTTTTVDLQPILDAIRIVNDNIDEFETNLFDYFDVYWSNQREYFDGWFGNINQWFDIISDQISDWCGEIYYSLQDANKWLERIFYKSGGGSSGDEPDVTIQPDDFWDWLGNVLTKYTDIPQDFLDNQFGDFVNLIRQLTGKFPFSVPWDIAYMLGLLSHTPVTPAFNFWMPSISNGQIIVRGTQVNVDLAPFDGVAAVCRRCELFLFAIGLTKMTFKTLQDMEWTIFS